MVGWIIILLIVLCFSGYLVAGVLPRAFLTLRYTVKQSNDRCIKRVYEVNGQSMVFEPEIKWRKYIEQYVISERKEKKQIMVKTNKDLSYIVYDVAVFNCRDELTTVIKVNDYVDGSGYGKVVDLPEDTSYVAINVLRADLELFEDHLTAKLPKRNIWNFLGINALLVLMETVWIKICISNIFGGIFRESFALSGESFLISLMIAGALIVANSIIALIAIAIRKNKYTVKVKKDA